MGGPCPAVLRLQQTIAAFQCVGSLSEFVACTASALHPGAHATEDDIKLAEDKFEESFNLASMGMFNLLENDVSVAKLARAFTFAAEKLAAGIPVNVSGVLCITVCQGCCVSHTL